MDPVALCIMLGAGVLVLAVLVSRCASGKPKTDKDFWFRQIHEKRGRASELLREIRYEYKIGDVCRNESPGTKIAKSNQLRAVFIGLPNSGKSSLFVSIATTWNAMTADSNRDVMWFLRRVSRRGNGSSPIVPVSTDIAQFKCELEHPEARAAGQNFFFNDTRGIVDNGVYEAISLANAESENNIYKHRGDEQDDRAFIKKIQMIRHMCNLMLLVIAKDERDSYCIKSMLELKDHLVHNNIPYLWVITKDDLEVDFDIAEQLNVSEADILRVSSYLPTELCVTEEKHNQLALFLAKVIRYADWQGLQFAPEPAWRKMFRRFRKWTLEGLEKLRCSMGPERVLLSLAVPLVLFLLIRG